VMDDYPHFEFRRTPLTPGLHTPSDVFEIWSNEFDYMYNNEENGVYVLTLHPYISGRAHRIMMVERLIQHMMRKKGVWFTRCEDVARCWKD